MMAGEGMAGVVITRVCAIASSGNPVLMVSGDFVWTCSVLKIGLAPAELPTVVSSGAGADTMVRSIPF